MTDSVPQDASLHEPVSSPISSANNSVDANMDGAPREAETRTTAAQPVCSDLESPFWDRLDAKADWFSDYLNPILVKEIRQALKSRSFVVTFAAVLFLAWGWSIFGIALRSPSIYYVPGGRYMLLGYFVITLLPLILVVPFATYRSLASEREDGTYELLSITDLRPWKIVFGKLSGAMLQIAIFLSALTPCLAITYFLRGIDIFMIMLFISATALLSILLCAVALIVGAQGKQQRYQAVSAIVLLLILLFAGFSSGSFGFSIIISGVVADIRNPQVWTGIAMVVSIWLCLLTLLILGAAASITFPSDNRSTHLRVAMLVTHAVWFGWITYIWQIAEFEVEVLYAYVFPTLFFWWLAAAHSTGESTVLTPRVRRGLPQSFLGRMLGTLFFPGRGIGYFFAMGNLVAMLILTFVLQVQSKRGGENVFFTAMMGFAYVATYAGLANIILRISARAGRQGAARGFLANIALIAFGVFIPLSIQLSNPREFGRGYHPIQTSNPFWTMAEFIDGSFDDLLTLQADIFIVPILVGMVAIVMLLINFFLASHELMAARTAVPERVREEAFASMDAAPKFESPQSPWDEP